MHILWIILIGFIAGVLAKLSQRVLHRIVDENIAETVPHQFERNFGSAAVGRHWQ